MVFINSQKVSWNMYHDLPTGAWFLGHPLTSKRILTNTSRKVLLYYVYIYIYQDPPVGMSWLDYPTRIRTFGFQVQGTPVRSEKVLVYPNHHWTLRTPGLGLCFSPGVWTLQTFTFEDIKMTTMDH